MGMNAGGNMPESAYRYTARQGRCKFNRGQVVATVSSFHDTQPGSENDLTNALARVGPVSVAIDASASSFRRYRSGVRYSRSCSSTSQPRRPCCWIRKRRRLRLLLGQELVGNQLGSRWIHQDGQKQEKQLRNRQQAIVPNCLNKRTRIEING